MGETQGRQRTRRRPQASPPQHPTPHLHHSTERNGSMPALATDVQVHTSSFPGLPSRAPMTPLHYLFLLISASAHLDGVQQGLQTDT